MTKNYKKWNMIAGTSIGAILLVSVLALGVLTPQAEAGVNQGVNGNTCEIVEHWDKIIFENEDDLLNAADNIVEEGSIMDIKVLDDPDRIEFPMKKAVQFLNDVDWTTEDGEDITLEDLELIDVEYAIVCIGIDNNFGT